jgi:hypothetical protein
LRARDEPLADFVSVKQAAEMVGVSAWYVYYLRDHQAMDSR